jgi:hypothetical protein
VKVQEEDALTTGRIAIEEEERAMEGTAMTEERKTARVSIVIFVIFITDRVFRVSLHELLNVVGKIY